MITLTDAAAEEIRRRLDAAGGPAVVRVGLQPGGCAGTKHVVEVGSPLRQDDRVAEGDGFVVAWDPEAASLLEGLVLDWVDALMGGGWRFANPHAAVTCGCGESFRPRPAPEQG
ncbi:MAG: HesB/IscA family protein [Candidatus Krumholzibacteriia bacterium]